jgi:serine/threonine-protein kinase
MEYLGHRTLADLIAAKIDAETALLLGEQILRGLSALHEKGIIHRDLKPENVMVDDQFRLKLIDFGLAKPMHDSVTGRTVSQTKGLVGTFRYMSPEQVEEESLTLATDVWSFGSIVHEMLTGRALFDASTAVKLFDQIRTGSIPLDPNEIPTEVHAVVKRCLNRDANQRLQKAGDVLQDYQESAKEASRRLRHDRYRERWVFVLEKQLLEQFAAHYEGRLPKNALQRFSGSRCGGRPVLWMKSV